MNTENSESNATSPDVSLDDFAQEFFGTTTETVQDNAPVEESADDTSPSDADDTKPVVDTSEADPDSNEGEDLPVEKPKKKTAAERISEVVAERNAERDRNAALQARLEALEASVKTQKVEEQTAPSANELAGPDPDARLEDGSLKYPLGEYDAQYLSDRVDFLFKQKEEAARIKSAEEEAKARADKARTELQQSWENRLQEAERTEGMADLRESAAVMVSEIEDQITPEHGEFLATTIMRLDHGPDVLYYLASNTEVAKAIASLDAVSATIALGEIQERVRSKKNPETGNPKPRISNAPEPPKNVNRGSNGRFETPDDTDDLDAFSEKFFAKRR